MVATVGSIKVAFDADLRAYEASLKRGEKVTDTATDRMARSVQGLEARFTKLGGVAATFGKGLVAGLAAGGIAGIISQVREVAAGVASIGDEAKRAGVSLRAFQEWKFVAQQNRIGIDQMTDGLKELNLRADEFVQTGKGSAAEAFQRLGYGAADLKEKLKDPSALLLEIIDRLGKFDKAAQIRISDELFGGSAGERFVELLSQGQQGIADTIQRAHELGIVLDDDLIAKAVELDRRFNEISNTVGARLKSAIVSAADSLVDFINAFKGFEFERTTKLDEHMADLGKERLDIERQILELKDKQRKGESVGDGIFGTSIGESTYLEAMADHQRRLEAIAAEEERISKIIEDRRVSKPAASTWTPPTPPPGGFGSTPKKTDAEREAESRRKLIADLQHELSLIGESETAKRISNELRKVGADATSKEGKEIAALITQIDAENAAQARLEEQKKKVGEAGEYSFQLATDALSSIVDGSETAEEALKKLVVQLALAAAQAAILGTGPLSGLFSGSGGGIVGGVFC